MSVVSHKHKKPKGTNIYTNTGAPEGGVAPDWTCGGGQTHCGFKLKEEEASILAAWELVSLRCVSQSGRWRQTNRRAKTHLINRCCVHVPADCVCLEEGSFLPSESNVPAVITDSLLHPHSSRSLFFVRFFCHDY